MATVVGGNVVWDLDVEMNKFTAGVTDASKQIDKLAKDGEKKIKGLADTITSSLDRASHSISTTGDNLIKLGAAPTIALGVAANAAIKFDDSLADVSKTTGIAGSDLDKLGKDLLNLTKNTRSSTDELLTIAEIGGQLGIAEKDILSFTKSVDIFNVALGADFSGGVEQAATAIGKLTSLFKETNKLEVADAINRAGSAINYLGAVGAGTTANMAEFATRMGQLPGALRPTITDALALGTLFEEMGISAEIASGGLTNLFLTAGKEIEGFAVQMGITTQAAKDLLATDPTEFAVKFAKSLKGLRPDELATRLDSLKIGTQETIKVVGVLGGSVDRFRFLQKGANEEFKTATSLINEFNTKNNNTAAQYDKLINNLNVLSITIGTALLPSINELLTSLIPMISAFADFAQSNPGLITGILGLGAAVGALGLAFKTVSIIISGITAVTTVISTMRTLATTIPLVSAAVGGLNTAFLFLAANPIILVIAAIVIAIGILGYVVYKNWDTISAAFSSGFKTVMEVLSNIGKEIVNFGKFLLLAWDTIVALTALAIQNLVLAIVGPVARAVFTVINYFDQIKNAISTTWNGIVSFLGSLGTKILAAIIKPFFDAYNEITRIATKIKEAADKINPFHRESPSLVDNVISGINEIKKQYSSLGSIDMPIVAQYSDPMQMGSQTENEQALTGGGGPTEIHNHIGTINEKADIERLNREFAFRLSVQ